jgi:phage/plasmid-associated DNA primase
MSSEGESGDKLRAGLLKNVTGHDLIQARDLYKTATEFRSRANFIFLFNEIPGVDDNNGGIERRLALINFLFKFVEAPSKPNEKRIDNNLQKKFEKNTMERAS